MALAWAEAEMSNDVIIGMIILCQQLTSALFDPRSTYLYAFIYFVSR